MVLLFVFGAQVFEDAISDLAFLELEPFTFTFFVISLLHVIKTIIRDLDLLVDGTLKVKRAIQHCLRKNKSAKADADMYASDVALLSRWHGRYDRFFLRHQNFISEMSCKAVALT